MAPKYYKGYYFATLVDSDGKTKYKGFHYQPIDRFKRRNRMITAEGAAAAWLAAKGDEDAARTRRLAAEEALIASLGGCKPEGTRTEKLEGFKVTFTGRIIRSLDRERWQQVRDQVPADLRPIKIVEQVDDAGCRWLIENDPALWALCAQAITSKPAKVGVKVVLQEE